MINLVTLVGTSLPRLASRFYPDLAWKIDAMEREAYLTFDDGPNPDLTRRIVDVLARFDASGTFFLLGRQSELHPELVREIVDAGHVVGNHTYSHINAWRAGTADVVRELERTTLLLEGLTERPVSWMRPPYGRFTRAMREWCIRRRQKLTMWDVGPGDFLEYVSARDIERHVAAYVRPGSIIVLHDNPRCSECTPQALHNILERMTGEGWRFPRLPELT